jgi:hypothetical protein
VAAYAATPPNHPRRCILTDYFNNYNFSKAQIISPLMIVIKPKHVGAVLMYILIFFKAALLCISWYIKDIDIIDSKMTISQFVSGSYVLFCANIHTYRINEK